MRRVGSVGVALLIACTAAKAGFEARSALIQGDQVVLRGLAIPGSEIPRVWDGDSELEVLGLEWLDMPPRVIFVVDSSGSSGRLHRLLRGAAGEFLNQWPQAEAALVAFGSDADVIVPPTEDHAALLAGFGALKPIGKNSISSGVGLGLTLAEGHPRAIMVVLTDGFDTPGAVPLSIASGGAQCLDVPIYSLGIGNRVEMPLLEELASTSGGRARAIETPLEAGPRLAELASLLDEREARVRARLVSTEPLTLHRLSVGPAPDEDAILTAYGPWPEGEGAVTLPVLAVDGSDAGTPILVSVGEAPVAFGRSSAAIVAPATDLTLAPAVAPLPEPLEVRIAPGESVMLPPLELGGISVTGPELGLTDGTPVMLLADGEPMLLLSTHEWADVLPGVYQAEVRTSPVWRSEAVSVEAGQRVEIAAPELGDLVVEVSGPDGELIPTTVRLFTEDGDPAGVARAGRARSLPAGLYRVVVPVPPERTLDVEVTAGQVNTVALTDYGHLRITAHGPFGEALDLGLAVHDTDGVLLLTGRTGRDLPLRAGQYSITVGSVPPYEFCPVEVQPGGRTDEDLRVFGGLYVAGGAGGRYRLEEAETGRLIGRFLVGETLVLVAGEYAIEAAAGDLPPLPVNIRAGMVSRIDLP